MTGRIIFTPPPPSKHTTDGCPDMPKAKRFVTGTIWKCDVCLRNFVVFAALQGEHRGWRLLSAFHAKQQIVEKESNAVSEQNSQVEISPGGIGFIRTNATKPSLANLWAIKVQQRKWLTTPPPTDNNS